MENGTVSVHDIFLKLNCTLNHMSILFLKKHCKKVRKNIDFQLFYSVGFDIGYLANSVFYLQIIIQNSATKRDVLRKSARDYATANGFYEAARWCWLGQWSYGSKGGVNVVDTQSDPPLKSAESRQGSNCLYEFVFFVHEAC